MVTVSPATAWATTADAFCFKARTPTSLMFYKVALQFEGDLERDREENDASLPGRWDAGQSNSLTT